MTRRDHAHLEVGDFEQAQISWDAVTGLDVDNVAADELAGVDLRDFALTDNLEVDNR